MLFFFFLTKHFRMGFFTFWRGALGAAELLMINLFCVLDFCVPAILDGELPTLRVHPTHHSRMGGSLDFWKTKDSQDMDSAGK